MTDKTRTGRPPIAPHLKKVKINPRIPQWLVDWMGEQDDPQSILIERAMEDFYDICAPVHKK